MPKIQREIEFRTNWLEELQAAYEQFQNEPTYPKAEVNESLRSLVNQIEELTSMIAQVAEIAEEQDTAPAKYLSRQEMSIRLSHKHRQN